MNKALLEKHDGYALVTLNRPEHMNALSRELRADLTEAFHNCEADEDIRVVILTGKGKAFCAGLDLKELSTQTTDASQEIGNEMAAFSGPIIAAVNGHAVIGGFELALACDVIIASESALCRHYRPTPRGRYGTGQDRKSTVNCKRPPRYFGGHF